MALKKAQASRTSKAGITAVIVANLHPNGWLVVGTRIDAEVLQKKKLLEPLICDCADGECRKIGIEANEREVDGKKMIGLGIQCFLSKSMHFSERHEIAEEKAAALKSGLQKFGIQARIAQIHV